MEVFKLIWTPFLGVYDSTKPEKGPLGVKSGIFDDEFEHILWRLLKTLCRSLEVYLNFALAQLTDKRDPMYYTSK